MITLARRHAPDTSALIPCLMTCCRPRVYLALRFPSPSTQASTHHTAPDPVSHPIVAGAAPLKAHSWRESRRTRQRLTSYDFIESARRSTPAFAPAASRRALPIKIWRQPLEMFKAVPHAFLYTEQGAV